MNNYFISYDLINQKNYPQVEAAIRRVDSHAVRVLFSMWYAQSNLSLEQVSTAVANSLDRDDKLVVIEAKSAWGSSTIGAPWNEVVRRWSR